MRPIISPATWAVAQTVDPTQQQPIYDEELAAALGVSQRTVRNAFAVLADIGALESTPLRVGPRGSRPTRYVSPIATSWVWAAVKAAA
jgi:DNA-binding transcriptional ArsR family regulator